MSLVAKFRSRRHRAPEAATGSDDRDLVAFINEARTDAERRAVMGLAALRSRGSR